MRRFVKMLFAVLLSTAILSTTILSNTTLADTAKTNQDTAKTADTKDEAAKANQITVQDTAKANQITVKEIVESGINAGSSNLYSEEDVFLTAQLIYHEAHNQSYNGKVAVAEVVLNRVRSKLFPNTINDVICQSGQFSHSRRIKNIQPTELELRIANSVLNGGLRVFNDTGVLYFRNPQITSGFSAKIDKNWGSLDYVTYIGDHAFYSQNIYNKQLAQASDDKSENKSILSKLPTKTEIASFITGKKKDEKKDENTTIVTEKAENAILVDTLAAGDEATVGAETNESVDESAAICEMASAATGVTEEVAQNAMAKLADGEPLHELTPEETVYVNSAIMFANATIAAKAEKTQAEVEEEVAPEDEVIDESDPVAVAQKQARINEKLRVQRIADLEAANVEANEAAADLAEANVQQAVERAATLIKAGQVETDK